jgi:hypothetical protein
MSLARLHRTDKDNGVADRGLLDERRFEAIHAWYVHIEEK